MDDTYLLSLSSPVADRVKAAGDTAQVTLELDVSDNRGTPGNSRRDFALLVDGAVHDMWHLEGAGATELWKSFDGTHSLKSNDIEHFVVRTDTEVKSDYKPLTAKKAQDCELSDISLVGQTKLVEFDLSRLSSCHSAGKAIVLTEYVADLEEQRTG